MKVLCTNVSLRVQLSGCLYISHGEAHAAVSEQSAEVMQVGLVFGWVTSCE